jgi:YD repeat-containing protein
MRTGQEMLPPGLNPTLILDVLCGAEAPLFSVTARHGAFLSAFVTLDSRSGAGPPFPSFQLRRVPRPCRVFCDRAGILTYPGTTAVNYTYDNDSRLTQVTDPTGAYQFTFDSMGRLTGTTTQYAFLNSRTFTNSYSYDAVSNGRSVVRPLHSPKSHDARKGPLSWPRSCQA